MMRTKIRLNRMAVILATFTPTKGKQDEVEDMLLKLVKKVREKEPKIEIFKPYKAVRHADGCPEFCVYQRYVRFIARKSGVNGPRYPDEQTLDQHRHSEHYKSLIEEAISKGHLTAGPHYRRVSSNTECIVHDMSFWRNLGYDDWTYLYGSHEEQKAH
jgi:quinol monooxygenase YgiN